MDEFQEFKKYNIFLTNEVKEQLREIRRKEQAEKAKIKSPSFQKEINNLSNEIKAVMGDLINDGKELANGNFKVLKHYISPSIERVSDLYETLYKMPVSDTKKHAYLSCIGAQGGLISSAIMDVLGSYKEVGDALQKTFSKKQRENYGGVWNILRDGAKDLNNNWIGRGYGMTHPNLGACDIFLKDIDK